MSSKVKCLFGKHDFIHEESTPDFRCKNCSLSIIVYDGAVSLSNFAIDEGPDFSQHPYFYEINVDGVIMASSHPLTDEEVKVFYNWQDAYWNDIYDKNEEEARKKAREEEACGQ